MKVSDFIVKKLEDFGIEVCFAVTGGSAMHLNHSFSKSKKINTYYFHHEQSAAIAAEGYAKVTGKPALICVTSGPGGTNTLTGIMGSFIDSIPVIVLSGQVKYETTKKYNKSLFPHSELRALGDQEIDIVNLTKPITKYSEILFDPLYTDLILTKAYNLAIDGRKGPVWIDIPIDVQGSIINTSSNHMPTDYIQNDVRSFSSEINDLLKLIEESSRPIFYVGSGIRTSSRVEQFRKILNHLNIPVVLTWNSIDVLQSEHELYVGRAGILGDRPGNFAVANSDLIIVLGNRLSIRQVGYNYKSWANNAFVYMVDADESEFHKHTIHVEYKVLGKLEDYLDQLETTVRTIKIMKNEWTSNCLNWRLKYPVLNKVSIDSTNDNINIYSFLSDFSKVIHEDSITVVSNGSACVVGSQVFFTKINSRFIINSGAASMGYGLPASIGASIASPKRRIYCIEGDGSIMMNLQELQTVKHNNSQILIFIINNDGYHSIRQTQNNFFPNDSLHGVGSDSNNDISFPEFSRIADGFQLDYVGLKNRNDIMEFLSNINTLKLPLICEVFVDKLQGFEPRNKARIDEKGNITSTPLEDMYPYLSDLEMAEIMKVSLK